MVIESISDKPPNTATMYVQLQPARSADMPTIQQLARSIWRKHYPEIISEAQIEYMLEMMYALPALEEQLAQGHQFFLVAMAEGQQVGFVSVSREKEGNYFLHKFYIDTLRHRQGIGSQVFQLLLERLPDVQQMRLTVNRRNFRSINFYFKMGFTIEKIVEKSIGNGFFMDDFQMLYWKK